MPNKARIFVVEDHAATARALRMYLENHGYEVIVADSVASGLKVAEESQFDVLVCDISLPDGSGWDLMKKLSTGRAIRGLAFTASGSPDDIARSRKVGFLEHLVKGSAAEDLVAAIERALISKPHQALPRSSGPKRANVAEG